MSDDKNKQAGERRYTEAEVSKKLAEQKDRFWRASPSVHVSIGIEGIPNPAPALSIKITGGDYADLKAIGDRLAAEALAEFARLAVPDHAKPDPAQ